MKIMSARKHWSIKAIAICSFTTTVMLVSPAIGTETKVEPVEAESKIDPSALVALDEMGKYLGGLDSFKVTSDFYNDEVMDSGQKILINGSTILVAQKPNRLFSHVVVDEYDQDYNLYFDGKIFSLYGKTNNFYASVPAEGTVKDLVLTTLSVKGVELPLADLFLWGTPLSAKDEINEAAIIADTNIAGIACTHYAFRQEGFDWQIWIQEGDKPLPIQLVITTTDIEYHPQYAARMQWDLEPKLSDDMFTLTPPEGAAKIGFAEMDETESEENSVSDTDTKKAQ